MVYFSNENIWRYNAEYINSKSIPNIKEHLKDKDSLILISDYSFNQKGFLTKVKNYNVQGIHTSSIIFEINEYGNILKKRSYNGTEWKILKDLGTKQTQNTISDNNTTRIIKKRWLIEKKYDSDGRLRYISKKKFNSDSLITIEIFDRRSLVRKSHNRKAKKAPIHVPQITRYEKTTYKYSKKGQLLMIKHFNNPFIPRSKRHFIYSEDGIIIAPLPYDRSLNRD